MSREAGRATDWALQESWFNYPQAQVISLFYSVQALAASPFNGCRQ